MLATDGNSSYALFLYEDITWSEFTFVSEVLVSSGNMNNGNGAVNGSSSESGDSSGSGDTSGDSSGSGDMSGDMSGSGNGSDPLISGSGNISGTAADVTDTTNNASNSTGGSTSGMIFTLIGLVVNLAEAYYYIA